VNHTELIIAVSSLAVL